MLRTILFQTFKLIVPVTGHPLQFFILLLHRLASEVLKANAANRHLGKCLPELLHCDNIFHLSRVLYRWFTLNGSKLPAGYLFPVRLPGIIFRKCSLYKYGTFMTIASQCMGCPVPVFPCAGPVTSIANDSASAANASYQRQFVNLPA